LKSRHKTENKIVPYCYNQKCLWQNSDFGCDKIDGNGCVNRGKKTDEPGIGESGVNDYQIKTERDIKVSSFTDGKGVEHEFIIGERVETNIKQENKVELKGYGTCYNYGCKYINKDNECDKTDLIHSECPNQIKTDKNKDKVTICYNNACTWQNNLDYTCSKHYALSKHCSGALHKPNVVSVLTNLCANSYKEVDEEKNNDDVAYCYNNVCIHTDTNNKCGYVDCKNQGKMSKVVREELRIDDYEKE
jgi:hypothetical protein